MFICDLSLNNSPRPAPPAIRRVYIRCCAHAASLYYYSAIVIVGRRELYVYYSASRDGSWRPTPAVSLAEGMFGERAADRSTLPLTRCVY